MIHDLLIILNLIVLEGLLSVDNAAVLATVVRHLPVRDQKHALTWGIWGAYLLRGLCLFVASWLIKLYWLKVAGGLYLIYLAYGHFSVEVETPEETVNATDSGLYKWALKTIGINQLWATIILVEWLDLVFSMDNVFAAVALSDKYWVIIVGVFIGIAAMRLVAGWFLSLMNKYPSLTRSAFIVIGLLGVKLIISGISHYIGGALKDVMEWRGTDLVFSALMMLTFFYPIFKGNKGNKENKEAVV